MSENISPITTNFLDLPSNLAVLESISSCTPGTEVKVNIDLGEGAIMPLKFLPALQGSDALIVHFHGAVDRSKRSLPTFQPNVPSLTDVAHQVCICDPTIIARDGFPLSWYIGHEALPLQNMMRAFFDRLRETLDLKTTIFTGSSGGGFAALYYSFFDPDSAAVVMVPQTNIATHRASDWLDSTFLKHCWSSRPIKEVAREVCTNVCDLYRSGFENRVVYMQSSGDAHHSAQQMVPFLEAIRDAKGFASNRFALHNDFWGKTGHSKVVPFEVYGTWFRSLLEVRSNNMIDVMREFHRRSSPEGKDDGAPVAGTGWPDDDLRKADTLSVLLLEKP